MEIENLKKNIASNIRQQRAKNKISQEKLSELTGISQQFICNIENEKVNPSVETLLKIANSLNITINELVY
ncbi:helix-turn-helix transcriptional regulator [Spirochaetes bacterium]|uniref:Helix-turn-helix transcriptional regulator n=1 Tax=Candidatus Scatousia excrementipullorum TaxID=2840936 RepID=A0A9D9H0C8_9BACT|nr:helix-turn-helix transcriptional regulator [Candidatus Scatousia excrementipullorum]